MNVSSEVTWVLDFSIWILEPRRLFQYLWGRPLEHKELSVHTQTEPTVTLGLEFWFIVHIKWPRLFKEWKQNNPLMTGKKQIFHLLSLWHTMTQFIRKVNHSQRVPSWSSGNLGLRSHGLFFLYWCLPLYGLLLYTLLMPRRAHVLPTFAKPSKEGTRWEYMIPLGTAQRISFFPRNTYSIIWLVLQNFFLLIYMEIPEE